jgi:Big-like domain-containing protein
VVVVAAVVALGASTALPQGSSAPSCEPPHMRGATSPGGAAVSVTVRNTGRPCRIRIMSDVDAGLATTEIKAVEEPRHGSLEFPSSSVAAYTPRPGYIGPDSFVFVGRGPTSRGRTVDVRLNVKVTVVAP